MSRRNTTLAISFALSKNLLHKEKLIHRIDLLRKN